MTFSDSVVAGRGATPARPLGLRRLAVTWQHPGTRRIQPVGILVFDGARYFFNYIQNVHQVVDFRPLVGFRDLTRTYNSPYLFPLFSQRAMDPRRPDYQRYVTRLGLDADATPWEQIARSGGRREGDTLQLFPVPTVDDSGVMSCAFLVHGVRHILDRPLLTGSGRRLIVGPELETSISSLRHGDDLYLRSEPDNPVNPDALLITTVSGFPLGWLPDLLVDDVRSQDFTAASVVVERVNGPDALWHLRILARISVPVSPGFRPFSSPEWQPYQK
jgi:hypothetical protein